MTSDNLKQQVREMLKKHGADEGEFTYALEQAIYDLILDIIGDTEYRETDDMSLKSWSNDDYKAFGRNELRAELSQLINGAKE